MNECNTPINPDAVFMKTMSVADIRQIIRRELDYWNAMESDLSISAVGACANILAATYGIKAPWHIKVKE